MSKLVKYMCYTSGSGLVLLAIHKNTNFDPSRNSVASEIFHSLILKNDPCLKTVNLKLFIGNEYLALEGKLPKNIHTNKNCNHFMATQKSMTDAQKLIWLGGSIRSPPHPPSDKGLIQYLRV